jgi:hypothetical protein
LAYHTADIFVVFVNSAPETLLGLLKQGLDQRQFDFGTPMDLWSTACVAIELFLGMSTLLLV